MKKGYSPTLKILAELKSEGRKLREDKTVPITLNEMLNRSKAAERANNTVLETKQPVTSTESRTIITSSKAAAKESIILRKNIEKVVNRIKLLESIVKEIANTFRTIADPEKRLLRIRSILSSMGDAYKLRESILEEGTSISTTLSKLGDASFKSVINAGLIASLIALLSSPQVREELLGFAKKLLEIMGVSESMMGVAGAILGSAVGLLGAYFTYSALKPVITAYERLTELARLLGVLAVAVDTKNSVVTRRENDLRRKRQKTAKRLKALKNVKTFISGITKFFKGTGIGFAIGVGIDLIGGTIIDIATTDPDVELNPTNVLKIAYNNLIDTIETLPFMKGRFKKLELDKEIIEDGSSEAFNSTSPTMATESYSKPLVTSTPLPVETQNNYSAPEYNEPNGSYSIPEEVDIKRTIIPRSTEGASVESSSRELVQKENDLITSKNNALIIVNNTENIFVSPEESSPAFGSKYSAGVGY